MRQGCRRAGMRRSRARCSPARSGPSALLRRFPMTDKAFVVSVGGPARSPAHRTAPPAPASPRTAPRYRRPAPWDRRRPRQRSPAGIRAGVASLEAGDDAFAGLSRHGCDTLRPAKEGLVQIEHHGVVPELGRALAHHGRAGPLTGVYGFGCRGTPNARESRLRAVDERPDSGSDGHASYWGDGTDGEPSACASGAVPSTISETTLALIEALDGAEPRSRTCAGREPRSDRLPRTHPEGTGSGSNHG